MVPPLTIPEDLGSERNLSPLEQSVHTRKSRVEWAVYLLRASAQFGINADIERKHVNMDNAFGSVATAAELSRITGIGSQEESAMEASAFSGAVMDIANTQSAYDTVFDAMIANNVSQQEQGAMETRAYNGAAADVAAAQQKTPQQLMVDDARSKIAETFQIPPQDTREVSSDL